MGQLKATIKFDSEEWKAFQAKARRNGTNASFLVRRFVELYMDGNLRLDDTYSLEKSPEYSELHERLAAIERVVQCDRV